MGIKYKSWICLVEKIRILYRRSRAKRLLSYTFLPSIFLFGFHHHVVIAFRVLSAYFPFNRVFAPVSGSIELYRRLIVVKWMKPSFSKSSSQPFQRSFVVIVVSERGFSYRFTNISLPFATRKSSFLLTLSLFDRIFFCQNSYHLAFRIIGIILFFLSQSICFVKKYLRLIFYNFSLLARNLFHSIRIKELLERRYLVFIFFLIIQMLFVLTNALNIFVKSFLLSSSTILFKSFLTIDTRLERSGNAFPLLISPNLFSFCERNLLIFRDDFTFDPIYRL